MVFQLQFHRSIDHALPLVFLLSLQPSPLYLLTLYTLSAPLSPIPTLTPASSSPSRDAST